MVRWYPVQSELRAIPKGILDQAYFQALGGSFQLFFFYSWMSANDAGIYEINLIDFQRVTGQNFKESYQFENYCKAMNQGGFENVVMLDNGRKILYPYLLWFQKGGVLNLEVEHDAWCYSQWMLHHIPEEVVRTKFNVINDEKFDFDLYMQNMDIHIRSRSRITAHKENYHPKIYQTHYQLEKAFITNSQMHEMYENLKSIYPVPPKRVEGFTAFYHWYMMYDSEYNTAMAYTQRKKRDTDFKFPLFKEFLTHRMYLIAD